MVGHAKKSVGIGWQINPDDLCFFVDHMIDEAWVLMAKTVMILPPYMRAKKIVEGCNGHAPWDRA